jgi:hypothetical protein
MCFKPEDIQPSVRNRGVASMCDHSLDFVASRPARIGDKLISTRFDNTITREFAAVGEPNVAVCVLLGTEIAYEQEVEYRHALLPNQKVAERLGRFRKVNMEQAFVHHDALEFPNGKIILLAPVRRPARDRAAVAGCSARHERSRAAESCFPARGNETPLPGRYRGLMNRPALRERDRATSLFVRRG